MGAVHKMSVLPPTSDDYWFDLCCCSFHRSDHSSWVLVGYFPTNVEISIAVKEEFYQHLHKACKIDNH